MNYLHDRHLNGMSLTAILWKINLQLIFVIFISINGFTQTQEKTIENPVTNQNEGIVIHSEIPNAVISDSLKRLEAMRLYMTPVSTLKENKEKSNSNPPPTTPKK